MAVDDEPLALDLLENNIKKVSFLKLEKRCQNVAEATQYLVRHPVDLIFLDVEMPEISGLEFLRSLSVNPPKIVLITAYHHYAHEGYDLDVTDYLLKPVSFDRFLRACNRVLNDFRPPRTTRIPDYFFVSCEYKTVRVDFDDIAYVEGLKDYAKIHLISSSRPVITRMSLKSLEEELPADRFIRVHKSYIVSISKIEQISRSRISINNGLIPVSENYRDVFENVIRGIC